MVRKYIAKLQSYFVDEETLNAYRTTLPFKVGVSYKKEADNYVAFINQIDGNTVKGLLITQATTLEELSDNINQLIYAHSNVPPKVRIRYGNIFTLPINDVRQKSGKLTLLKA